MKKRINIDKDNMVKPVLLNHYSKDFKYTLKSKEGKIILQEVVTFGSKEKPFPQDWKDNPMIQMAIMDYKDTLIRNNFDILVSEDLEFDI
jgi:mRNA-degrading endonuclease YafQ of YafQ-DinJ toxin-antitoxin module